MGSIDPILDRIHEFITGERDRPLSHRVLMTVLFTDIVGSTKLVGEIGDRRWREVLDAHDRTARRQVERFGGRLVQTTGELCLSPVGLSEMTKLAPRTLIATLMATWFLGTSGAQWVAAQIAKLTAAGVLDPKLYPATAMYPRDLAYDEAYDLSGIYRPPVLWVADPHPQIRGAVVDVFLN